MNDWLTREAVRFFHEHSVLIIEKTCDFAIDKYEEWRSKRLEGKDKLNSIIEQIERE